MGMKGKTKTLLASIMLGASLLIVGCSNNESNEESKEEQSQKLNYIMLRGDTVSEKQGCVLASRFTVGDKIIFRIDAIDPNTNEQIKDANIRVELSTGETLDMTYGAHPPGSDVYFYTAAYEVTENTPTGKLTYKVIAEKGDMKGEFEPFNVEPSVLTIVSPDVMNPDGTPATAEAPTADEKVQASAEAIQTNQTVDIVATNFKLASPTGEQVFYVKAGEEVTMKLTSKEGHHGVKVLGIEGEPQIQGPNGTVKFTPTKPGEYQIVCSVFCGAGHGDMTATLIVV